MAPKGTLADRVADLELELQLLARRLQGQLGRQAKVIPAPQVRLGLTGVDPAGEGEPKAEYPKKGRTFPFCFADTLFIEEKENNATATPRKRSAKFDLWAYALTGALPNEGALVPIAEIGGQYWALGGDSFIVIGKAKSTITARVDETPGSGTIEIYKIGSGGDLETTGREEVVFNLGTEEVEADTWVQAKRESASGKLIGDWADCS